MFQHALLTAFYVFGEQKICDINALDISSWLFLTTDPTKHA